MSDNSEVESCSEGMRELGAIFMCKDDNYAPQLLSHEDLNDFVRDLALSKEKAEPLASRLQQNNFIEKNICVTYCRKRRCDLASFLTVQGPLCYCHDVHELFQALSQKYEPDEWSLFIDASKTSLKLCFCTKVK